jgi:hypothetical protein
MATTSQSPREDAHYTLPDTYAHLSEINSPVPEENPYEAGRYGHSTLEEARGVERVPDVSEGGEQEEQEQEQEPGCLCMVVKSWVKRTIRRKRGS